jgi:hypothetical protein
VLISTFGIYAGFTADGQDSTGWGPKYQLDTRDLLEMMREIADVRLLVGVSEYKSCRGDIACKDCETQYVRQMVRLHSHADAFPEFRWRFTTELHLKCVLFQNGQSFAGVAGGRNFSDSKWADVTFELNKKNAVELSRFWVDLWRRSTDINNETIDEFLQKQKVSADCLDG